MFVTNLNNGSSKEYTSGHIFPIIIEKSHVSILENLVSTDVPSGEVLNKLPNWTSIYGTKNSVITLPFDLTINGFHSKISKWAVIDKNSFLYTGDEQSIEPISGKTSWGSYTGIGNSFVDFPKNIVLDFENSTGGELLPNDLNNPKQYKINNCKAFWSRILCNNGWTMYWSRLRELLKDSTFESIAIKDVDAQNSVSTWNEYAVFPNIKLTCRNLFTNSYDLHFNVNVKLANNANKKKLSTITLLPKLSDDIILQNTSTSNVYFENTTDSTASIILPSGIVFRFNNIKNLNFNKFDFVTSDSPTFYLDNTSIKFETVKFWQIGESLQVANTESIENFLVGFNNVHINFETDVKVTCNILNKNTEFYNLTNSTLNLKNQKINSETSKRLKELKLNNKNLIITLSPETNDKSSANNSIGNSFTGTMINHSHSKLLYNKFFEKLLANQQNKGNNNSSGNNGDDTETNSQSPTGSTPEQPETVEEQIANLYTFLPSGQLPSLYKGVLNDPSDDYTNVITEDFYEDTIHGKMIPVLISLPIGAIIGYFQFKADNVWKPFVPAGFYQLTASTQTKYVNSFQPDSVDYNYMLARLYLTDNIDNSSTFTLPGVAPINISGNARIVFIIKYNINTYFYREEF